MKYHVHVEHYWTYEIEADSPEEAARYIEDGDHGAGECTGYSIEAVNEGQPYDDDLRADNPCRGGCGEMIPAVRNDECAKCLLKRLAERDSRLVKS